MTFLALVLPQPGVTGNSFTRKSKTLFKVPALASALPASHSTDPFWGASLTSLFQLSENDDLNAELDFPSGLVVNTPHFKAEAWV